MVNYEVLISIISNKLNGSLGNVTIEIVSVDKVSYPTYMAIIYNASTGGWEYQQTMLLKISEYREYILKDIL